MSKLSSDLESFRSKTTKRAIIYDPMTFGYKVMIESNSGKRPSWIWQIRWPQWAPASAPSKQELSMFWSTYVPNFMLVDKSAQYPPTFAPLKCLRAWTMRDSGQGNRGSYFQAQALYINLRTSYGVNTR